MLVLEISEGRTIKAEALFVVVVMALDILPLNLDWEVSPGKIWKTIWGAMIVVICRHWSGLCLQYNLIHAMPW